MWRSGGKFSMVYIYMLFGSVNSSITGTLQNIVLYVYLSLAADSTHIWFLLCNFSISHVVCIIEILWRHTRQCWSDLRYPSWSHLAVKGVAQFTCTLSFEPDRILFEKSYSHHTFQSLNCGIRSQWHLPTVMADLPRIRVHAGHLSSAKKMTSHPEKLLVVGSPDMLKLLQLKLSLSKKLDVLK